MANSKTALRHSLRTLEQHLPPEVNGWLPSVSSQGVNWYPPDKRMKFAENFVEQDAKTTLVTFVNPTNELFPELCISEIVGWHIEIKTKNRLDLNQSGEGLFEWCNQLKFSPRSVFVQDSKTVQLFWLLQNPWALPTETHRNAAKQILAVLTESVTGCLPSGWALEVMPKLTAPVALPMSADLFTEASYVRIVHNKYSPQELGAVRALGDLELHAPQMTTGESFVFDTTDELLPMWGDGDDVLWSSGESLIIAGSTGVGKSTLAQNVLLASLGIGGTEVLGQPVQQIEGRALYIAADRPPQIRRSLRRMVSESDRAILKEKLLIQNGPPDVVLSRNPDAFASWVIDLGVSMVVIDSLKDVSTDPANADTALDISRGIGLILAAGIEVVFIHHQRKATSDNRKPTSLDDVFGSAFLTAKAGSVLVLWSKHGSNIVQLHHVKQPANEIGPLEFQVDSQTGAVSLLSAPDYLTIVKTFSNGVTCAEIAGHLNQSGAAAVQNIRHKLNRLVDQGFLERRKSGGRTAQVRYFVVERLNSTNI